MATVKFLDKVVFLKTQCMASLRRKQTTKQYEHSPPSDNQMNSITFGEVSTNGKTFMNGEVSTNGKGFMDGEGFTNGKGSMNGEISMNGNGSVGIDVKLLHDLQYRQLVSRLRGYVLKDRYYAKPDISRDELIAALSTNRTTLSEAVRAVTNNMLMGYLNILRLEEAKRMLDTHPELTIETIAENCGFNLRTFHRLFIERYQITPAKYRIIHVIDNMTQQSDFVT